jgi:hypothetical protein
MSSHKPSCPRRRIRPHSPWRPGKARNGKIARLPETLRQSINLMLLDGLTYEAIINQLGPERRHLNYHNLKRWRQGGYQDWLIARQSADASQLRHHFVQKIISQSDPKDLPSKIKAALATQTSSPSSTSTPWLSKNVSTPILPITSLFSTSLLDPRQNDRETTPARTR